MSDSKVVWGEGTLISPQHFQQQERYLETLIAKSYHLTTCHHWGFVALDLQTAASQTGVLEVASAKGFFKNGAYFEENSKSAPCLKIDIPPNITAQIVYLVWDNESAYKNNYTTVDDDISASQYVIQDVELLDATEIDLPKRSIVIARKNLRLALSDRLPEDALTLPVARILTSNSSGEYHLDETFIPPMLSLAGHQRLVNYQTEIFGMLKQRAQSLAIMLTNPALMTSNDVRDFLILQTVNRYHAHIHHLESLPTVHPCDLYECWIKLYGDLSTFESAKLNLSLPRYDHDHLDFCYGELSALLKQALSIVLEQKAVLIPFEMADDATRVAITPDVSLLNNCQFVLAVNADMQPELLRQKLPATIKIGSVNKIKDLVAYHLPGIKVQALTTAPRELPYYAGFSYFELDKSSELWGELAQSSGIAMHLAGEFPKLQIEFWAIKPVY